MDKLKGDFRKLIYRFINGKKDSYTDGDYKINKGRNNKYFNVYIRDKFAMCYRAGLIDGEVNYIGAEQYEKMVKIIQEFYPEAYDFYG